MRPDCWRTSSRRYSALATRSGEAEGFRRTVAPATAWKELGGTGAQRSSQISTARVTPGSSGTWNRRSVPKGTISPARRISASRASRDDENQRSS